jgi:hypothetical protein
MQLSRFDPGREAPDKPPADYIIDDLFNNAIVYIQGIPMVIRPGMCKNKKFLTRPWKTSILL